LSACGSSASCAQPLPLPDTHPSPRRALQMLAIAGTDCRGQAVTAAAA